MHTCGILLRITKSKRVSESDGWMRGPRFLIIIIKFRFE